MKWILFIIIYIQFFLYYAPSHYFALQRNTDGKSSSRYDQFHPSGRVLQLDYAMEAVNRKGGPISAIRCADGLIIVVARVLPRSTLQLQADRKVFFVDRHICVAVTGLVFDANALLDFMKKKCVDYEVTYGSVIPVEVLCDDVSNVLHSMTLKSDSRPLAVNLVVAGIDSILGPQLYSVDMAGRLYTLLQNVNSCILTNGKENH